LLPFLLGTYLQTYLLRDRVKALFYWRTYFGYRVFSGTDLGYRVFQGHTCSLIYLGTDFEYSILPGTGLQPFFWGHTYSQLLFGDRLGIPCFSGAYLQPYLFRDRLAKKDFSGDRLGLVPLIGTDIGHTFFIQGQTCQKDFSGDIQPASFLLRDSLTKEIFPGVYLKPYFI